MANKANQTAGLSHLVFKYVLDRFAIHSHCHPYLVCPYLVLPDQIDRDRTSTLSYSPYLFFNSDRRPFPCFYSTGNPVGTKPPADLSDYYCGGIQSSAHQKSWGKPAKDRSHVWAGLQPGDRFFLSFSCHSWPTYILIWNSHMLHSSHSTYLAA